MTFELVAALFCLWHALSSQTFALFNDIVINEGLLPHVNQPVLHISDKQIL